MTASRLLHLRHVFFPKLAFWPRKHPTSVGMQTTCILSAPPEATLYYLMPSLFMAPWRWYIGCHRVALPLLPFPSALMTADVWYLWESFDGVAIGGISKACLRCTVIWIYGYVHTLTSVNTKTPRFYSQLWLQARPPLPISQNAKICLKGGGGTRDMMMKILHFLFFKIVVSRAWVLYGVAKDSGDTGNIISSWCGGGGNVCALWRFWGLTFWQSSICFVPNSL